MPHQFEPRVLETTTTTGTGALTLAGAVAGYRTWGSACAVNDTAFYYVEAVDSNGVPTGAYEVGLGTYSATDTLTRSTVIRSSNSDAAVNFAAGTKRVGMWAAPGEILSAAPSANQDDYNGGSLAALLRAEELRLGITASLKLTGLAATYDGHTVTIANTSSDYLLWLENQNTASVAANRFVLPLGLPWFLMPGDRVTLRYSETASRWQFVSATVGNVLGLAEWSDFVGGNVGPFTSTVSGTSATTTASTYQVNTTGRVLGAVEVRTGTTATGRATLGHATTAAIVPTLGPALSVARVGAQALPDGTNTYQFFCGFADSAGGTMVDGVAWNLRWNGTAAEWAQDRWSNSTATRSTTGSPTPDTNYVWLVVFVNAAWSRADFIYSTDGVSFTVADSPTTGLPGNTRYTGWVAGSIIKSAGTTSRIVSIDLAGYRVDHVRA